jgi:hypothetical protein
LRRQIADVYQRRPQVPFQTPATARFLYTEVLGQRKRRPQVVYRLLGIVAEQGDDPGGALTKELSPWTSAPLPSLPQTVFAVNSEPPAARQGGSQPQRGT